MNNKEALNFAENHSRREPKKLTRKKRLVRTLGVATAILGLTIGSIDYINNKNKPEQATVITGKEINGVPNLKDGQAYINEEGKIVTFAIAVGDNPTIAKAFKAQNSNSAPVTITGKNFITWNGIPLPPTTGSIVAIETKTEANNGISTSEIGVQNNYILVFTGEKTAYEPNYEEEVMSSGISGEYTVSNNNKEVYSGQFTAKG